MTAAAGSLAAPPRPVRSTYSTVAITLHWLIAAGVTLSSSAALLKLFSRAAASKARSALRGGRWPFIEMRFSKPGAEKVSFAEAWRKPKFIGKTLPGTTLPAAGKI